MSGPFTLRVFVPSGDPKGTRVIDRMNWTGSGIYIPRDDLFAGCQRPEMQKPGVYVLLGHEDDGTGNERPVAYIGQAEHVGKRLQQHDGGKDFWDRAMAFVSNSHGLNRAHIVWLEWALMVAAQKADVARMDNGLSHSEPQLSESEKADTRAFLNEMLRLMPVMGITIFEPRKTEYVRPEQERKASDTHEPPPDTGHGADRVRDVIIVPAKADGFQSAFLDANAWWAIRIGAKQRAVLKYIAAYQVLPVAAVTHIADIDRFEPYGDEGKYKVVFKGTARELDHPIPYGDAVSGAMQGPRYCSHEQLANARSVADLAS
ncbi:MAG: GIY-YIG nuclease family protein [Pacificimonas sp.]